MKPDGLRPDTDRWIEAILGARLRFHGSRAGTDPAERRYWQRVYKRWAQLYHRTYS